VTKYQKRISGPLLDRIDIHIEVPRVDYEKLSGDRVGETSEAIRARVQSARDLQNKRFSNNGSSEIVCNADMRVGEIRQFCRLQEEGVALSRVEVSAFDAGSDDAVESIGACLSSRLEVISHDCGPGGE
jgi:magnesium chelatase family protein